MSDGSEIVGGMTSGEGRARRVRIVRERDRVTTTVSTHDGRLAREITSTDRAVIHDARERERAAQALDHATRPVVGDPKRREPRPLEEIAALAPDTYVSCPVCGPEPWPSCVVCEGADAIPVRVAVSWERSRAGLPPISDGD